MADTKSPARTQYVLVVFFIFRISDFWSFVFAAGEQWRKNEIANATL